MRSSRLACAVLLAVALISCTNKSSPPAPSYSPTYAISASPTPSAPDEQIVSYGSVAFGVPRTWVINDPTCGKGQTGLVLMPAPDEPHCIFAKTDKQTVLSFTQDPTTIPTGYHSYGLYTATLAGHAGIAYAATSTTPLAQRGPDTNYTDFPGLGVTYAIRYGNLKLGQKINSSIQFDTGQPLPLASPGNKRVSFGPLSIEVPTSWAVAAAGHCSGSFNEVEVQDGDYFSECAATAHTVANPTTVLFVPDSFSEAPNIESFAKTPTMVGDFIGFRGSKQDHSVNPGNLVALHFPGLAVSIEVQGGDPAIANEILDSAVVTPLGAGSDSTPRAMFGINFRMPAVWSDKQVAGMISLGTSKSTQGELAQVGTGTNASGAKIATDYTSHSTTLYVHGHTLTINTTDWAEVSTILATIEVAPS